MNHERSAPRMAAATRRSATPTRGPADRTTGRAVEAASIRCRQEARRADRRTVRGFAEDDAGVSEAIGYIITFGISTVILVTSLSAMTTIQDYTEDIARDRAADEIAAQVAFQVQQALKVGDLYPEADASFTIPIPRTVAGSAFTIVLAENADEETRVIVSAVSIESPKSIGALGTAEVPVLNKANSEVLCTAADTEIDGGRCSVMSSGGEITIVYGQVDLPGDPGRWGVYIKDPLA